MKGIIFNLLERAVVAEHGEDVWDDLLESADSDGVFTALGQYEDDELLRIVTAVGAARGGTPDEVLTWFGRSAIPMLAEGYPGFFTQAPDLTAFLTSLNDVIHSEVRKLYPGAVVPVFDFIVLDEGGVEMTYRSPRSMCHLAIGFTEGAAAHYGERVTITQATCTRRGDDTCVIVVEPST